MKIGSDKILKTMCNKPLTLSEIDTLCKNTYTSSSYLLYRKWINYSSISEDGEPLQPLVITETGVEYITNKVEENRKFIKSFFTNFLCGFISGVLIALVSAYLLHMLGL